MTSNPTAEGRPDAAPREREWLPLAAFVFVVLALVALAVAPAVLLRRISAATEEITTVILPANDRLEDLAFVMERQVAASRSLFLTGDPRYAAELAAARAAEAGTLRSLDSLAPRLGPASAPQLAALRGTIARRDSLEAAVLRAGGGADAYRAALPAFDALRDSMLVQVKGLRDELARATAARAAEEARWARLQRVLSIALGTVALLAALLVGWFAWRQRLLVREVRRGLEEANRLRVLAERRGDELERITDRRVRMIRGITHDVKNPLGAAKGYAELLEMGAKAPLAPEQAPLVKGVQRSVDGALAIIADLLDLARADSGALALHRVQVDLGALARSAAEDHRSAAEAARHTLVVQPLERPLSVHTDPGRVGQVLGNLLSNAIKYTPPPGRITVRVGTARREDAPQGSAWATVRVSDTGPGIPPAKRDAVFDEFTRLEEGGAQKGHGLGLAIARRIARLLGGDLTVEGPDGAGATFVVWLPLRREDDAPRTPGGPGREGAPSRPSTGGT